MDRRAEFPGLARTAYLNSCAHGLLPTRTRRAVEAHLERWAMDPDWDAWGAAVEDARAQFAALVHAEPRDVAIVANASAAASVVMGALPRGGRDRILTTDLDFPTSPVVAERQRARGLRHEHLRALPRPLGVDEWRRRLGPDVALACIPAVASFTGYRLDVAAFQRAARDAGVPLLVDAFQAAGTFDIDVERLDLDFLVTGTYKWLLGPVGVAFLYVKPEHQVLVPTTGGWHALDQPYSFDPLGPLAPDARRFQYGGADVMGSVAAAESLRLVREVGVAAIERHNAALVEQVVRGAEARKWEVLPAPTRGSIVTFRVPDLARALDALRRERVVVNDRLGGIRVSPHFYNEAAHVERLFEVLDAL